MADEKEVWRLEAFKAALQTRNAEIQLFWQRSNYFLLLSAGSATAFFSMKDRQYAWILCLLGTFIALLWVGTNLGSKYWQSRWEERLRVIEAKLPESHDLFTASPATARQDVVNSFEFGRPGSSTSFYARLVLWKPSVTRIMTWLSLSFVLVWIFLFAVVMFGEPCSNEKSSDAHSAVQTPMATPKANAPDAGPKGK